MDEASQREIARRFVSAARARGVEVVLVGSTAIIAHALFPKTSKDADALAPVTMDLDAARRFTADIASEFGGAVAEAGWGVLSILPPRGQGDWRMDLIIPGEGPIPSDAARLIRTRAIETSIGWAACPEHVLVMKAAALGDCLGKGDKARALDYESDIMAMRDAMAAEPDWQAVQQLLRAYPDARARLAIQAINDTFGSRLPEPRDPTDWT